MMATKSRISFIVSAIILVYVMFNVSIWKDKNALAWDSSYYYLYLPATIIYDDLGKLGFYPEIIQKYNINGKNPTYEIYPQAATGYQLNKYAVGVSIFELPFFLAAHLFCTASNAYPADGYSKPYMLGAVLSNVFWVLAGLWVLRKFLLEFFNDSVTAITLLLIMFGTNLYFYTVFDVGMSHPFSFALFAFLLHFTERAYSTHKSKYIVWVGAVLGMIVITRPTNLLVVIVPLLWPGYNNPIDNRLLFFREKIGAILLAVFLFTAIAFIQLGYLKYTSGDWFHFSYEKEGFNFLKPEIVNGLFSYRKGWFLYTPIALFAVVGLISLMKRNRGMGILISVYLAATLYVIFSWWDWTYGGSFGCRPMIESLAILSIPMAALVENIFAAKNQLKVVTFTVLAFFIALNLFQSYQLFINTTMWNNTNKAFYWRSFGKLKVTEEDRALLKEK